jgi:hypothetical protein
VSILLSFLLYEFVPENLYLGLLQTEIQSMQFDYTNRTSAGQSNILNLK